MELKKLKKHKETWKYDYNLLFSSKEFQDSYSVAVRNRFELLQEVDDVNISWQQLREIITVPATEIIPRKEQKSEQKWMTSEILNLMADRRIARQCQDATKYTEKDRLIRKKCIQAKEEWFNERYEEIEVLSKKNPQLVNEKV